MSFSLSLCSKNQKLVFLLLDKLHSEDGISQVTKRGKNELMLAELSIFTEFEDITMLDGFLISINAVKYQF